MLVILIFHFLGKVLEVEDNHPDDHPGQTMDKEDNVIPNVGRNAHFRIF